MVTLSTHLFMDPLDELSNFPEPVKSERLTGNDLHIVPDRESFEMPVVGGVEVEDVPRLDGLAVEDARAGAAERDWRARGAGTAGDEVALVAARREGNDIPRSCGSERRRQRGRARHPPVWRTAGARDEYGGRVSRCRDRDRRDGGLCGRGRVRRRARTGGLPPAFRVHQIGRAHV